MNVLTPSAILPNSPGLSLLEMYTPLVLYQIDQFVSMDSTICPVTAVAIVPWSTGTSADYFSSDGVTFVNIYSWSASTIKITIPPISGESTRLFKFRVRVTAENV